MSGENDIGKVTYPMVLRKGFFGKNIGRYPEVAGLCGGDECVEVDDAGSAHQHEKTAGSDERKLTRTKKFLVFSGDARENENCVGRGEQFIERGWRAVIVDDLSLRQPWIINFDCAAEWSQHGTECPRQIAIADDSDATTREEEAIPIALQTVDFVTLAESPIVF